MTASTVLPGLMLLVGTLAGIGATWVANKRRYAGKIATSEAADVWKGMADLFAASESIRHDLTARCELLERRISVLESSNAIFEQDNRALRGEVARLEHRLEDYPHA